MKRIILSLLLISITLILSANATDLFFSEYVEGSSNNKALEIFNGTGQTVDLSAYTVKLASNGGTWGNTLVLSGTLANGEVYVITNASANSTIAAQSDITSTVTYFNGDDAVGLFNGTTLIDLFGTYNSDPGTGWNVAGITNATLDHTLVRKSSISSPSTDWAAQAGTDANSSQWIVYPIDTFTYLGSHTMDQETPSSNPPVISNFIFPAAPPLENADHIITATVTDADADLNEVKLYYQINDADPIISPMVASGNDVYTSKIPKEAYENGDKVEYWVWADDSGTGENYHLVTTAHYKYLAGTTYIFVASLGENTPQYNGILVRVEGICTGIFHPATNLSIDAYLQDNNGGINIKKSSECGDPFIVGHNFTVIGTIGIANNRININPTSVINNGVGIMPNPIVTTIDELMINPESKENMLIELQNVTVTTGTWPVLPGSGTLYIDQAANVDSLMLYLDTDTQIYYPENPPTGALTIRGIYTQYNTNYEIMPRTTNDITPYQTLPVTMSSFTATLTASNTVSLQWITESESNVQGYYVFRNSSANQNTAERISSLIPAGNTSSQMTYAYSDEEVEMNNTYYYWVVSYELNGHTEWHGAAAVTVNGNVVPQPSLVTTLNKTYPNPFNSGRSNATIELQVKDNETAHLFIYNVKGQVVRSFLNIQSGNKTIQWDGRDLNGKKCSNGIYFYKLTSPTITTVKKVMVVK